MAFAKLTQVQATIINNARSNSNKLERQAIKREIFGQVKRQFGIPADVKLKAETTNISAPNYLVLHDKAGNPFLLGDNGCWVHSDQTAPILDNRRWYKLDTDDVAETVKSYTKMPAATDVVPQLPAGAITPLYGDASLAMADGQLFMLIDPAAVDAAPAQE